MSNEILEDDCIACGIYINDCPVAAITIGFEFCTIDAFKCTDCDACAKFFLNEAINPNPIT